MPEDKKTEADAEKGLAQLSTTLEKSAAENKRDLAAAKKLEKQLENALKKA